MNHVRGFAHRYAPTITLMLATAALVAVTGVVFLVIQGQQTQSRLTVVERVVRAECGPGHASHAGCQALLTRIIANSDPKQIELLRGARGPAGPQGVQGARGPRGLPGSAGKAGASGARGSRGSTGAPGPVGAIGPPGPQGTPAVGGIGLPLLR